MVEDDWRLLANKTGPTRLGFSLILKYFEIEGRFPRYGAEVPRAAVDYVASQVKVAPEAFGDYQWSGRTVEYHRAQIRKALGFREATVSDEDKLATWLAEQVCPVELSEDRLREALVARCRAEQLEPPAPSRIERVVGTARAAFDHRFTTELASRLSGTVTAGLEAFVAEADDSGFLAEYSRAARARQASTSFSENPLNRQSPPGAGQGGHPLRRGRGRPRPSRRHGPGPPCTRW